MEKLSHENLYQIAFLSYRLSFSKAYEQKMRLHENEGDVLERKKVESLKEYARKTMNACKHVLQPSKLTLFFHRVSFGIYNPLSSCKRGVSFFLLFLWNSKLNRIILNQFNNIIVHLLEN